MERSLCGSKCPSGYRACAFRLWPEGLEKRTIHHDKAIPWSQTAAGTAPACSCRIGGFQDCRELAAHFAWVWRRMRSFPEDEIRDKLGAERLLFTSRFRRENYFILPEETEKAIDIPTPRIRLALGAGWSEGYFAGRRSRNTKTVSGKHGCIKMDRGAGAGGKENPGEIAQELHLSISLCETPPDGDEEGRGLRFWSAVPI